MKKRIVCLTLALLMSATQVVSVSASREDELREEQAITSQQLDATYSRMDELAYAKSQLENEISELDSNLVSVMVSIDTLKGDIDNKEVDIIKTKQDLAKAQKARDKQYESMKLRIQALYEQGGDAAWFQMMLNSEDLSELLTRAENTQQMYEQDRKNLDKYVNTINEVNNLKTQYESDKAELEEKIGKVAFKSMELEFKAMDEKLIPLMQEENALTTRYDNLIASAKIDWDGETLNLSLLRPYMTHEDREIRRRAHEKYSAFFQSKAEELDEIYDKLVKNRTAQARLLGYENYVELGYYRMNRNSYGREEVENFRRQIKEYFVPLAEKMHERRRERLGLQKLSYIDENMYFVDGNPKPQGTPEEIMANGQKMYEELSPETKEFFEFMMENELFDVLGRKTKKAGGYMTYLPKYRAPFIFANFNGTSGDVDVVTHECGHAFQGYVSGSDPIEEHWDITMETAEIHSMSMEFFTEPWMNLFFKEEADTYRQMHLEDAIAFIPYGCMVDEFQHIVYSNPDLTPDERHAAWKKLEEEYKPHLDYEGDPFMEKGGFWQKQLHIYDTPFYYIDYVLAQTCAMQYKIWMDEDYKAAWQSYLKLCRLSASDFYTEMLKEVGFQVPFEEGCVRTLTEKLGVMMK